MKEIVIKIPWKVADAFINDIANYSQTKVLRDALRNGKVLPKGHGELKDLKDISKLPSNCTYHTYGCDNLCHCGDCTYAVVSLGAIKKVNTIVEADKEN